MPRNKAVILFAQSLNIDIGKSNGSFPVLPWEDLDVLHTAMIGDFVKNTSHMPDVDILLYRDPKEISDDIFLPYQQRVQLFTLTDAPFSSLMYQVIENTFSDGYENVVLVLDNYTMVNRTMLHKVFSQLTYEDDCLIIGPTFEGKCYLIGMKMNHSKIFDVSDNEPMEKPLFLMKQICNIESMLFLLNTLNSLNTPANLMNLMRRIDEMDHADPDFPAKTYAVFKTLEKKYKLKKALQ